MEKEKLELALIKAKDVSKKRFFKQTYDLIINLKGLDLKKQEHHIDIFITLPHSRGKKVTVCALVGPELQEQAKEIYDAVLSPENFLKYKEKKETKKIADKFDYFVAQSNLMPQIANVFGRALGPRNKMPNPKIGAILNSVGSLRPLYEKLQQTIRVIAKSSPVIQCAIGTEDMSKENLLENAMVVYNAVLHALPNEEHNIKNTYVKLTMGKPIDCK